MRILFHRRPADPQSNEVSTRIMKQTIGRNEAKYFTDAVLIHFLKEKFPNVEEKDFKLEVRQLYRIPPQATWHPFSQDPPG